MAANRWVLHFYFSQASSSRNNGVQITNSGAMRSCVPYRSSRWMFNWDIIFRTIDHSPMHHGYSWRKIYFNKIVLIVYNLNHIFIHISFLEIKPKHIVITEEIFKFEHEMFLKKWTFSMNLFGDFCILAILHECYFGHSILLYNYLFEDWQV